MALRIFNTLSHRREEFMPLEPERVRIYTCGPTVYRYAHIGNLRTYLLADWLRRALAAQGYEVRHVKNITDVGHMRQEMLEQGEDKVIAAALAEGKTPAQIAQFYTDAFLHDEAKLNILPADVLPRATDHVGEMVELTKILVDKGFAYEREGNIYFDVGRFPHYGKLSGQRGEAREEGVRVEPDPLKGDQRDFSLWKAAEPGRTLRWPSPWGDGFPGWHIECSAMALKHLGPQIDIHTGGVDNIFPHHEDEIAQSEAALGHQSVRYWVHGQHLLVDGVKMAKSTGNVYTLADVEARGFEPLAFRYLSATSHYRARMNFTFAALISAQKALLRLRQALQESDRASDKQGDSSRGADSWRRRVWEAILDDLNIPAALAVAWELARSDEPAAVKRDLLLEFDRTFGLDLDRPVAPEPPPADIKTLIEERKGLRGRAVYPPADAIRERIVGKGYEVRDGREGCLVLRRPAWAEPSATISSSRDVPSFIDEPDALEFSVCLLSRTTDQRLSAPWAASSPGRTAGRWRS